MNLSQIKTFIPALYFRAVSPPIDKIFLYEDKKRASLDKRKSELDFPPFNMDSDSFKLIEEASDHGQYTIIVKKLNASSHRIPNKTVVFNNTTTPLVRYAQCIYQPANNPNPFICIIQFKPCKVQTVRLKIAFENAASNIPNNLQGEVRKRYLTNLSNVDCEALAENILKTTIQKACTWNKAGTTNLRSTDHNSSSYITSLRDARSAWCGQGWEFPKEINKSDTILSRKGETILLNGPNLDSGYYWIQTQADRTLPIVGDWLLEVTRSLDGYDDYKFDPKMNSQSIDYCGVLQAFNNKEQSQPI